MKNNTKHVEKKKINLSNVTLEEMGESIAKFTKELNRFGFRQSFYYALHGETIPKVAMTKVALEYAAAVYHELHDPRRGAALLIQTRELGAALFKNNAPVSHRKAEIVRNYIRDVIGAVSHDNLVNLDLPKEVWGSVKVDEQFLRAMCDMLTFHTPKWLMDIQRHKLTTVKSQFDYVDGIVSKPRTGIHYELFVTDGYHSDILMRDKRGVNPDKWQSGLGTNPRPVIGKTAEVRMFRIGLSKGKKPFYNEVKMGSQEYFNLLPLIPRISRELENQIVLAEMEAEKSSTPASQAQLDQLLSRFATK